MTFEEAHENHIKLWDGIVKLLRDPSYIYIPDSVGQLKREAAQNVWGKYVFDPWCFACEYTCLRCNLCPIDWGVPKKKNPLLS